MLDSQSLLEIINGLSSLVKDADYMSLAMLAGAMVFFFKTPSKKKPNSFRSDFLDLVDMNSRVITKLRHLKSEINADRVLVFQFHNGCQNLSGVDFVKMSCTHEAVRTGLRPAQDTLLNLPISAYSYLAGAAFGAESAQITSVDRLRRFDMSTSTLLKNHKAVTAVVVPLTSDYQSTIGFMLIEFTKPRPDITTPEFSYVLKNYSERVATLLDCSHVNQGETNNGSNPDSTEEA